MKIRHAAKRCMAQIVKEAVSVAGGFH